MDAVRKLILDRSVELEKPLSELSLGMGKNHSYLQQFIRRGTPKRLKEDEREQLAQLLNVSEAQLRGAISVPSKKSTLNQDRGGNKAPPKGVLPSIPGSQLIGERDLPVFASTQGGSGVIIVSNDPVEWVARPDPLARVRDGYGVIVLEDSMSPEFEPGDIALVHPHRPPAPGVTCIFKSHGTDGTIRAVIKRLRKVTGEAWHVRQWNPPEGEKADYSLKRSEWQECHVTVGRYSKR